MAVWRILQTGSFLGGKTVGKRALFQLKTGEIRAHFFFMGAFKF